MLIDQAARNRIDELTRSLRCLAREVRKIEDGGGGIGTETDPIFTASPAFGITNANITAWNNGTGGGGSYVTSNTNQTDLAGDKTWTGIHRFTAPWNGTTGQVRFGSAGQAGIVSFLSGNGSSQAFIGYLSATGTDFVINPTTASGTIGLTVGNNTALKIFNTANVVLGTGANSSYVDQGQKLQVLGTSRFSDNMTIEGNWSATGQLKLGNASNTGLISFTGPNTGVSQGYVGYINATSNVFAVANYSPGGTFTFDTGLSTTMKIFNDGSVVLQTAAVGDITSTGEKLQVYGTSKFAQIATFTDTYATGQASFGQTGQAARVIFNNGVNGAASLIIGYTASGGAIPEIRSTATAGLSFTTTNASAPMWFTTGGSESMRILANGNVLIGTTTDGGQKFQVNGTGVFSSGIITGGTIRPSTNGAYEVGDVNNRYTNVWANRFVNATDVVFGTTVTTGNITFRQGTAAQLIGGFYATTGNFTLQAPSSTLGTDTGERLQVEGTTRLGGIVTVGGSILSGTDNTYNIGASNNRFANGYIGNLFSPGTLTINSGSTGFGIQIRLGNATSVVGGFYPTTGNFYIQAIGTLTADTGQKLQVAGTSLLGGDVLVAGNIAPDGNGTRDNGSATSRWLNLFTTRISTGGIAQTLTFNADGTTATTYMGSYPTTRNIFIQPAGALTPDTGQRLQLAGSALLGGTVEIGGHLTPITNNTYNVGSSALKIANGYFTGIFSESVIGISGTTYTLGVNAIAAAIQFRQGSSSQIVGGIYGTSGNWTIQAAGATLGTDTGEKLQVEGTARFGGTVTLRAGTATAGTAPLKFVSGVVLGTAEVGAMEFVTDDFFGTITTAASRKKFVMADAAAGLTTGRVPYSTTNGRLLDTTTFLFSLTAGGKLSVGTASTTSNLNIGQTVMTSGLNPIATFVGGAHTGQTAGAEIVDINFNLARTVTWAGNTNLTNQRAVLVQAPVYNAATAGMVVTNAGTFVISGAPTSGANVAITNPYAFWVQSGATYLNGALTVTGALSLTNVAALGTAPATVLVMNGTTVNTRTLAQFIGDLGVTNIISVTASGTGATQILIPHGLGRTPLIVVQAANAAASGILSATADGTNYIINYTVAPATAANNLAYTIAVK